MTGRVPHFGPYPNWQVAEAEAERLTEDSGVDHVAITRPVPLGPVDAYLDSPAAS
jgi:hypothetical protein